MPRTGVIKSRSNSQGTVAPRQLQKIAAVSCACSVVGMGGFRNQTVVDCFGFIKCAAARFIIDVTSARCFRINFEFLKSCFTTSGRSRGTVRPLLPTSSSSQ